MKFDVLANLAKNQNVTKSFFKHQSRLAKSEITSSLLWHAWWWTKRSCFACHLIADNIEKMWKEDFKIVLDIETIAEIDKLVEFDVNEISSYVDEDGIKLNVKGLTNPKAFIEVSF